MGTSRRMTSAGQRAPGGQPVTLRVEYTVGIGLDEGRGRYLPEAGRRHDA